jgi:hypothetical protein
MTHVISVYVCLSRETIVAQTAEIRMVVFSIHRRFVDGRGLPYRSWSSTDCQNPAKKRI